MRSDRVYRAEKPALPQHYYAKRIAWPLYKYYAATPKVVNNGLDSLQRLFLSVVESDRLRWRDLADLIGIEAELSSRVRQKCIQNGLYDGEKVTEKGARQLRELAAPELEEQCETVVVFKDAITGDVVPLFKEEAPTRYLGLDELNTVVCMPPMHTDGRKVRASELMHALKIRQRINEHMKGRREEDTDTPLLTEFQEDDLAVVDWEEVDDDGHARPFAPEENNASRIGDKNAKIRLRLEEQRPELLYIETYLYIDLDDPEHWYVQSPFGSHDDWWFTKRLSWATRQYGEIAELVSGFADEVRDNLHDLREEAEESQIDLIHDNPALRSHPELLEIKKIVKSVYYAYQRVLESGQDIDTYFVRCQKALEALLDACIRKIDNPMELVRAMGAFDFVRNLRRIASELSVAWPDDYLRQAYAKKLPYAARGLAHGPRERAILLLLDAYYRQDESCSFTALRADPELFVRINGIVRIRNAHAHHSQTDVHDQEANIEACKADLYRVIQALTTHFFREAGSNGETK